nr:hypothetical protein [Bradyrhizobium sp. 191]
MLSTTPSQFEPMHRRKANGDVDPRPWCQGFYAATRLRPSAWAPLLDASNVNHGLLLPILLHCLSRRSGPAAARTATKRARDQGFSAQRPRRSSSGRRGHAPILDADPLRSRPLITADVGAHTGYLLAALTRLRTNNLKGLSTTLTTIALHALVLVLGRTNFKLD